MVLLVRNRVYYGIVAGLYLDGGHQEIFENRGLKDYHLSSEHRYKSEYRSATSVRHSKFIIEIQTLSRHLIIHPKPGLPITRVEFLKPHN